MQRVTESQYTFREINKVGRYLCFNVGITHFVSHIIFFSISRYEVDITRYNITNY